MMNWEEYGNCYSLLITKYLEHLPGGTEELVKTSSE
jgi:hypothetical protein